MKSSQKPGQDWESVIADELAAGKARTQAAIEKARNLRLAMGGAR